MKRTAQMMNTTSTARDTYPEEAINSTEASTSNALMPIDLLNARDLARFTEIRALDFNHENFGDNFDFEDPYPTQSFIAFVTSKKIPDDKEELELLCEYVLDQFPALGLNLFQTAEVTELNFEQFSDRATLGLIDVLTEFTDLKTFSAFNFSISMQTMSKFLKQNNSVVNLDLRNIDINGDNDEEFAIALAENSTIKNLTLEITTLSDNQFDCLSRGIAQNKSLEKLNFLVGRHWLETKNNKYLESIATIISQNSCIKKITIPTDSHESGIVKMVKAMAQNETITYFKLRLQSVSNDELAELLKIMNKNKSIEQLCSPKLWDHHFNASIGDAIRIELLSSIKVKMDRNAKFSSPATKDSVDGASIELFRQFQIPPEIALLISSFMTPRQGIGMVAVNTNTQSGARSYSSPNKLAQAD